MEISKDSQIVQSTILDDTENNSASQGRSSKITDQKGNTEGGCGCDDLS